MYDVSGHGGVARSVVNLANRLADHRDVRVVSLHRRAARFIHHPARARRVS